MQIHEYPSIPQAPADADVLAIEVNGITYKVSKSVLASAIIAKLGGDPVTVAHGGTGSSSASGARTNLSVYSKTETDSAIQQSTATLNLGFDANHDTWSKVYNILSTITLNNSALFIAQGVPAGVLTNGKITVAIKGIVNFANRVNGIYDFIAFTGYQSQYIWVWRISGLTSASVTPTVGTIYRFTGTAI